ncbi:MAG: hypothetical protein ABUL62_28590 [Myxococcales bacterium]
MEVKRAVLFVQGGGEGAHDQWDDKLVESLKRGLGPGFEVHYPRMPAEAEPSYAAWKPALLGELEALPAGAVLVAHSVRGESVEREPQSISVSTSPPLV